MKRILLFGAFLGVLALNASAYNVIDDFDSGPFDVFRSTSGLLPPLSDSQTGLLGVIGKGGAPGGQRDALFTFSKYPSGIAEMSADQPIPAVPGTLSMSLPTGVNGTLTLSYGSYTSFGQLDADVSAETGVGYKVVSDDVSGHFMITLKSEGTEYSFPYSGWLADWNSWTPAQQAAWDLPSNPYLNKFPGGGAATVFQIDYSTFESGGGILVSALKDIDGAQFNFIGPDAWDLTIDALSFSLPPEGGVPEPATMALLGAGVIALIRRRRKS